MRAFHESKICACVGVSVCVCACGSAQKCAHTEADVCVAEQQMEAPAGFMSTVVGVLYRG